QNRAIDILRLNSNGNVGIGTTSPSQLLALDGQAAHTLWMERETTAATAGNGLTLQAGGATLASSNKNGGNLTLSAGTATGNGSSNIYFDVYGGSGSGTSDGAVDTLMAIIGNGNTNQPGVEIGNSANVGGETLGVYSKYDDGGSYGTSYAGI